MNTYLPATRPKFFFALPDVPAAAPKKPALNLRALSKDQLIEKICDISDDFFDNQKLMLRTKCDKSQFSSKMRSEIMSFDRHTPLQFFLKQLFVKEQDNAVNLKTLQESFARHARWSLDKQFYLMRSYFPKKPQFIVRNSKV